MSKRTASSTIERESKRSKGQENVHFVGENLGHVDSQSCQLKLELGEDALKNAKFSKVLELSNSVINDTVKQHLKALHLRATALGMLANFKKAENDASLMIQLAPSQPIGYVCMGDLCELRGNQQQAIKVYQEGVELMESDQDREVLEQKRDEAIEKSNERYDIITNLPYDILNIVLLQLTQDERFVLFYVSKTLRTKAGGCSSAWKTVKFYTYKDSYTVKNIQCLQYIHEHITELSCMFPSERTSPALCDVLFDQLCKDGFNKLEKFDLDAHSVGNSPKLIGALSNISKTLKELGLRVNGIQMKDLKKILDLCPDLRSLTIDECKPAVLDIIQRNLKQLERLCIGKDVEFGEVGEYQQQLEASVSSSSSTGIRDIAITVTRPRDYVSIFESNQTTLKTLFLDVWCEPVCRGEVTDKKGWKLLGSACKFPNLQSLHCCADELLCNIVFTPLLQNSPCIRSLSLNLDPIIGLTESFTMAVVNMPSLQSLQIIEGGEGIEQDIEFILEGLASKGETGVSTLEDIRFVQTNFEMTVVVDSIARIQTLRHLEFNDVPSLEREDLIYLCPKLSSHPGIRSISLTRIGCIDNKMLRQLATIQGLERLHLESLSKITHRGLSAFNGSSVKLTIEDCESVEM